MQQKLKKKIENIMLIQGLDGSFSELRDKLLVLFSQQLENIFLEMEKVIGEDMVQKIEDDDWDDDAHCDTCGYMLDEAGQCKCNYFNDIKQMQRKALSNLKQEYLGKGKE